MCPQLIMYPRASARGIKASNLMNALCKLAGIKDIGIKIQVCNHTHDNTAAGSLNGAMHKNVGLATSTDVG